MKGNYQTFFYINCKLSVLKLAILIFLIKAHPLNISTLLKTLVVSKLDKSTDFNLLHPWNIPFILLIESVLKLVKFNEVKEVKKKNN